MNALFAQGILLQVARIFLPCTATVAAFCLAGALAALLVSPAYAQDPPSCPNPTPTAVAVTAVPIVVASTTADYFVLFVRPDLDADLKIPISVTLGEEGATTLTEQLSPLPKEHYLVEKYSIDDPADVDGDCISDIEELADLGTLNPINQLPKIEFRHGTVAIPDRETFERLSYKGTRCIDRRPPHQPGIRQVLHHSSELQLAGCLLHKHGDAPGTLPLFHRCPGTHGMG